MQNIHKLGPKLQISSLNVIVVRPQCENCHKVATVTRLLVYHNVIFSFSDQSGDRLLKWYVKIVLNCVFIMTVNLSFRTLQIYNEDRDVE